MSCSLMRLSALTAAWLLALSSVQAETAPAIARMPAAGVQSTIRSSGFIVTYREGSTEAVDTRFALQGIQAAVSRAGLDRATPDAASMPVGVIHQRRLAVGGEVIRTTRRLATAEASELMKQIAADPAVVSVEPNLVMHAVRDIKAPAALQPRAFTPGDEHYATYQWHYFHPVGGAHVDHAWDLADGSDVTVAVLDTGITRHPDLDLSLAQDGYDFIDDAFISGRDDDGRVPGGWDTGDWTTTEPWLSGCTDASRPPGDSSWHGTHVSGTVAERTDNRIGMAGIAYKAKVLPVRVLGHCGGVTSDIADAIVWASGGHVDGVPDNRYPAQVINMSLGGPGGCGADSAMARAIADARSRGVTVVVSAGNSSSDVSNFSPANCPGVVAVASNGVTGKRAFYSNYGSGITLSAPGGGIYANDASSGELVNEGFVWQAINAGDTVPGDMIYGGMAGTSQASPHVAGTVAMMIEAAKEAGLPAPTPDEIQALLVSSSRPFPVAPDRPIGAGILDAAAAVNAVLGNDGGEPAIPLAHGTPLSEQVIPAGGSRLYAIEVPEGARHLNIRTMSGGAYGDAVLYVKAGQAPGIDGSGAESVSDKPGNNESVLIAHPKAGTYYLRVRARMDLSDLTVFATYTP